MTVSHTGGCQCGAVRYAVKAFKDNAHICHCRMCQKAVGNYFATFVGVTQDAFEWTRGAPSVFASSEHVERGFCAQCGTPLFYRDVTETGIAITIGSLDQPEKVPPKTQDGIEGRMPFFSQLAKTPEKGVTGTGDDPDWAEAIAKTNRQHPDHDTQLWPETE